MKTKPKIITQPNLSLRNKDCVLNVYVGNPGDIVKVSECSCHEFAITKTASLVYESQPKNGIHETIEQEVGHATTWKWLQKWAERGMIAEGYMNVSDSEFWTQEEGRIITKHD